MIYGSRAHPLSFLLSRTLNSRLSIANVFCVDSEQSRSQNRLLSISDNNFQCTQLTDMRSRDDLGRIIDQNQITDVIDMTNTACKEEGELDRISDLPESVRIFSPIFTTPLDIQAHKASR